MRFYWRSRADTSPDSWRLLHAVIVDGAVVGACDVFASDFPTLRQFETGSWLGREFQGRGLGKEMRLAALHARIRRSRRRDRHDRAVARQRGIARGDAIVGLRGRAADERRRDDPDELIGFRMFRAHWETIRRDDITLHGVERAAGIPRRLLAAGQPV